MLYEVITGLNTVSSRPLKSPFPVLASGRGLKASGRITSYNVCYTKLLRDASTGNGDLSGRDDTVFKPKYRDVESYNLQIFNRWGQLIFESNDVNEGWNGMYNDQLSPQEVYVWKVKGKFVNGREFRETGSVLLVR